MDRAVCFDLDGTLLDPAGSIRDAIEHAVASQGLPGFAPDEVLIGMPLRDILRTRTHDAGRIDAMVDAFRQRYLDHGWRMVRWYDGVADVVHWLRDEGVGTAIVTTKGEAEAEGLMQRLHHADLWDTIVGDDDVRPLKPDPAPVIAACGRLGLHPSRCAMVGDTVFDIDAGRAAGTYTVGVAWGTGWHWNAAPDGADAVAKDARDLRRILAEWLARSGFS